MPIKPKRPCGAPGCPELTDGYYCEKHRKQQHSDYNQHKRDSFSKSFYNSPRWRETSKLQLKRQPLCEQCLRNGKAVKACIADHIVPVRQGGDRYDLENLQSLCWGCHNKKTAREKEKTN